MIGFQRAGMDPSAGFERPSQVLETKNLSTEQKIEILREWDYEVRQLQVATEENMNSAVAEPPGLNEIYEALEALGARAHPFSGLTKFG